MTQQRVPQSSEGGRPPGERLARWLAQLRDGLVAAWQGAQGRWQGAGAALFGGLARHQIVGLGLLLGGVVLSIWLAAGWWAGSDSGFAFAFLPWHLFGPGALLLVVALMACGVLLALQDDPDWQPPWPVLASGLVIFLCLLILAHLFVKDPAEAAADGEGGGLIGYGLSAFLAGLLTRPLATIVVLACAIGAAVWGWRTLPLRWTRPVKDAVRGVVRSIETLLPAAEETRGHGDAGTRRRGGVEEQRSRGAEQQRSGAAEAPAPATTVGSARKAAAAGTAAAGTRGRGDAGTAETRRRGDAGTAAGSGAASASAGKTGPGQAEAEKAAARKRGRPASLPPVDLLNPGDERGAGGNTDARQQAQIIRQTLAEFGVPVEVVSIKEGPTVTQFGLEPGEIVRELSDGEAQRRRVSVNRILRLSNDLALALAASSIRIEAPVPGRPYVGVEIPNPRKTLVALRPVLESKEYARAGSPLAVALGRDVAGEPIVADLTRMPHLLIAGATGSGKSVCINALVASLLMNNGPEAVRFLMIDPKMVELPVYNGIPHLIAPVVTDTSQATGALAWLTLQMDDRYRTFSQVGVRNIVEYNRRPARARGSERGGTPLPYLVLVIDELADLMLVAGYDVERQICRLAQMARATGIHLVLATQRPSVDVITGLIKANFPARIAFAVATQIDSRVILDGPGAEKLLGRGDMLFMAPESAKLVRVQGCYVSDREIDRLVDFWKGSQEAEGEAEDTEASPPLPWAGLLQQMEERDELLDRALDILRGKQQVSTSLLQRQLRLGYPRAARLMEQLEAMGAVGPDEGAGRSRAVLLEDT